MVGRRLRPDPLDYFAYLTALGADPVVEADAAELRPAFASLDVLVVALITPETERTLPVAEMAGLRSPTNEALLDPVAAARQWVSAGRRVAPREPRPTGRMRTHTTVAAPVVVQETLWS